METYNLHKVWLMDIETNGLLAELDKINTVVFMNCGKISQTYKFRGDAEGSIDKAYEFLVRILKSKDNYICGHNMAGFDIPAFAKMYGLDMLNYYDKIIDTIHWSALTFPKHILAKHKLNRNIPFEHKHLKDSHSLGAWSYRVSPDSTKYDYKGLSKGIFYDTKRVADEDIPTVHKVLKEHNITYSKEFMVSDVISQDIVNALEIAVPNIIVARASLKQLYQARWEVFDYDELLSYCVQDVKVNVMLLRYFVKQDYTPSRGTQKLEVYNALVAGYQTIHGWKIDVPKLSKLESKLTLSLKKLDLELEGMFEPRYIVDSVSYDTLWSDLFTLYRKLKLTMTFEEIPNRIDEVMDKLVKENPKIKDREALKTSILCGLSNMNYVYRNSSIWVPVSRNIPNSVGKHLCSNLEYTKGGKPKAIKAWEKILKYEDNTWYRKVPMVKTNIRDNIKLDFFKAGSRTSILSFMKLKYGYTPNTYTDSLSFKLDAEVFEKLPYREAPVLTERFRVSKQLSQVATIKKNLIDGRLHATTNVLGTNTYRTTSNNPNLAQIDTRQEFRELFIADEGMTLIGADQSGMEITMLGEFLIPYDNRRMQNIKANEDVHQSNADIAGTSRNDAKGLLTIAA